jgi:peptidoglycan/xylan/chitin deacetylase (PgdA/CDA1 family)
MYHEVLGDREQIDAWTVVKESDFRRQMEYLSRHFKVVSLGEALRLMEDSRDIGEKIAVVTFDDGYSGNRRCVLPIIEAYGIPITIFISTASIQNQSLYWWDRLIIALQPGRVGRVAIDLEEFKLGAYRFDPSIRGERRWTVIQSLLTDLKAISPEMREKAVSSALNQLDIPEQSSSEYLSTLSANEVKELGNSHFVTIGAHSHCHNILTQLDRDAVWESIEKSKRLLETWTDRLVSYFAYPNGDYNENVVDILRKTGFVCAMTTISRSWKAGDSMFAIPRIGVGRYDSFDLFKAKVWGIWP